jgi:Cell division control protein 24, OB domain 3
MPTKRSALQHFNPVKTQALDLLSDPQSPPEDDADEHSERSELAPEASKAAGQENVSGAANVEVHSARPQLNPSGDMPHRDTVLRSPISNRDRFMAGFLPARTCCNLDLCRAPAGSKFQLYGICIAVYPAVTNPDRRYVQLADNTGTVGVTVWNTNVNKFSNASVGSLVSLNKVSISSHHGKKQLTLTRDSVVEVADVSHDPQHAVSQWWQQLLQQLPKTCGAVHDTADNDIVAVSGVCGHVTSEIKMVNNVERTLTCIHLVDSSGRLDIRSWNHMPDAFQHYVDRPVLIRRVKVTSFAGTKMCEILDGTGSIIETEFPGSTALAKFWAL